MLFVKVFDEFDHVRLYFGPISVFKVFAANAYIDFRLIQTLRVVLDRAFKVLCVDCLVDLLLSCVDVVLEFDVAGHAVVIDELNVVFSDPAHAFGHLLKHLFSLY